MVPERKQNVNKKFSSLLVMEQNRTMTRVLVESKGWVISFVFLVFSLPVIGVARGGSWGARDPPFVSLLVSKQLTIFR